MLSIVKSIILQGLNGIIINVEVDISAGMPAWEVVGLPDTNIRESKERVKTAIKNCGIELPSRKYVINLSPANVRKTGAFLDLAIAIGILKSMNIVNADNLKDTVFIGELSLDGKINKVNGVLPMCIESAKNGIKRVIVPEENVKEASLPKDLEVIGVSDLIQTVNFLNNKINISKENIDISQLMKNSKMNVLDFAEVKGQRIIKRALEIAAGGGHNCLLIGNPGSRENNAC